MPFVRQADNSVAEEELTRAVRWVYERYGNDLNAFFRDLQEQAERNQGTSPESAEKHSDEQTDR
jgi:hypothetical protein